MRRHPVRNLPAPQRERLRVGATAGINGRWLNNIHIDGRITLRVVQKPIKTNTDMEKQVFICNAPMFLLVFLCIYWFFKRRGAYHQQSLLAIFPKTTCL